MEATCTSIWTPSRPHCTCKIDDELKASPQLNRWRPKVGIAPKITDAELITVSVMQALLRLPRREPLDPLRPQGDRSTCSRTCPSSPATTSGCAPWAPRSPISSRCWSPTPTCGSTRSGSPTPPRCSAAPPASTAQTLASWRAGRATATAPHTHVCFWGLRLHLVTTVHGLPVAFALTNPKIDERDVLVDLVTLQPSMFRHP